MFWFVMFGIFSCSVLALYKIYNGEDHQIFDYFLTFNFSLVIFGFLIVGYLIEWVFKEPGYNYPTYHRRKQPVKPFLSEDPNYFRDMGGIK